MGRKKQTEPTNGGLKLDGTPRKSNAGRPPIEIDQEVFENLCRLQCTEKEIASWFKCSEDTIESWCERTYGLNFSDSFAKYAAAGKISLRRTQFRLAENSAAMAIHLGKNYLGQTDGYANVNVSAEQGVQIYIPDNGREDEPTSE